LRAGPYLNRSNLIEKTKVKADLLARQILYFKFDPTFLKVQSNLLACLKT